MRFSSERSLVVSSARDPEAQNTFGVKDACFLADNPLVLR